MCYSYPSIRRQDENATSLVIANKQLAGKNQDNYCPQTFEHIPAGFEGETHKYENLTQFPSLSGIIPKKKVTFGSTTVHLIEEGAEWREYRSYALFKQLDKARFKEDIDSIKEKIESVFNPLAREVRLEKYGLLRPI